MTFNRSVSSTNKTDRHDITVIVLKMALNTMKQVKRINQQHARTTLMIKFDIYILSFIRKSTRNTAAMSLMANIQSRVVNMTTNCVYEHKYKYTQLTKPIASHIKYSLPTAGHHIQLYSFIDYSVIYQIYNSMISNQE